MAKLVVTLQNQIKAVVKNDLSVQVAYSFPGILPVCPTPPENSYAYPILTQTVSYRDGDEGWQLANVWNSIYGQNATARRAIIGLSDFYTLESNNQFGNTSRFTLADGSAATNVQFLVNQEIYDNYLGIIVRRMNSISTTWNNAVDLIRAAYDGSYYPIPAVIFVALSDLENMRLSSRMNNIMQIAGFNWSGTTSPIVTASAFNFREVGMIELRAKTENRFAQIMYKLIP